MRKFRGTRLLAIILMVTLFVGIVPLTPAGEKAYGYSFWPWFDFDDHFNDLFEGSEGDSSEDDTDSNVRINPLYEEEIDIEDIENYENGIVFDYVILANFRSAATVSNDITYADTISEAGAVLRSGMTARSANPIVYYKMGATYDKDDIIEVVDDIFADAIKHTGKPKEGDSLNFVWKSWGSNIGAVFKGNDLYLKIQYNIKYYTTASQEKSLDAAITSLKATLNADEKSDYAKVKAIYDYICKNIAYDYSNANDDSNYIKYTAYGALVNKTCVCQGYATLFYRLALEYGLDTRIITGIADGKKHAWNIVKLGGKYYYVDATWDAERTSHAYFLKGTNSWAKHNADNKYETSSFMDNYPLSKTDYSVNTLNAPNIEVVNVASSGKPKISWNAVPGADKYEVWRKVGAEGEYEKYYTTTDLSMTNTSTVPGIIYYYKVRAISENSESSFSNVSYVACDLPQPTNIKIEPVIATGKPKITWNAVEGASKYELWRKVGSSGTYQRYDTTTGTTYINSSTTPGTIYYYKVLAVCESNSGGNSAFSNEVYMACDLPQPTNIKIEPVIATGKPKITWNAVEGASKYELWRKVGSSGTYQKYDTTTGTTYINSSTTPGTIYYYKVLAVCESNSGGNSAFSNEVYMACDLPQPTNIKIEPVIATGKPKITWNVVDGASKYELWRKVGSSGTYQRYDTTTGTTYINSSTTPGTIYYYKVLAVCESNSGGNSAFSNEVYMACDLPQPTNIKIEPVIATGKPKITWNAVEGASKYELWRKVGSSGTYQKYDTTTGTTYINSSTTPGTIYYYKVLAVCESNSGGNSAFSNEVYMACDLSQPKATISLSDAGKPKITWNAVEGASKYELWRKVGSSGTYQKYDTTTGTTYINSSTTSGTTYYYKILAVCGTNSGGNSAYSNEVSITSK